jgi:hypothetical protein
VQRRRWTWWSLTVPVAPTAHTHTPEEKRSSTHRHNIVDVPGGVKCNTVQAAVGVNMVYREGALTLWSIVAFDWQERVLDGIQISFLRLFKTTVTTWEDDTTHGSLKIFKSWYLKCSTLDSSKKHCSDIIFEQLFTLFDRWWVEKRFVCRSAESGTVTRNATATYATNAAMSNSTAGNLSGRT